MLDIKNLIMNNQQEVKNFYITSHTKVDSIEQVCCSAKINENTLLEVNSTKDFAEKDNFSGNTSIEVFTDNLGVVLEAIGISDVLSETNDVKMSAENR